MKSVSALLLSIVVGNAAASWSSPWNVKWSKPLSRSNYTTLLQEDVDLFVEKLSNWTQKVSENANITVESKFSIESNETLYGAPCGDLIVHKTFDILKSFINHPEKAEYKAKKARDITWRPTYECVHSHEYINVDGGASVAFNVSCGENVLVQAISAGGGMVVPGFFYGDSYYGGSGAAVNIFDGEIEIVAGQTQFFKSGLELHTLPNEPKATVHRLHKIIQECAKNQTLFVSGVAGGGWTQKYLEKNSTTGQKDEVESSVGYATAFALHYGQSKEPLTTTTTSPPTEVTTTSTPVAATSTSTEKSAQANSTSTSTEPVQTTTEVNVTTTSPAETVQTSPEAKVTATAPVETVHTTTDANATTTAPVETVQATDDVSETTTAPVETAQTTEANVTTASVGTVQTTTNSNATSTAPVTEKTATEVNVTSTTPVETEVTTADVNVTSSANTTVASTEVENTTANASDLSASSLNTTSETKQDGNATATTGSNSDGDLFVEVPAATDTEVIGSETESTNTTAGSAELVVDSTSITNVTSTTSSSDSEKNSTITTTKSSEIVSSGSNFDSQIKTITTVSNNTTETTKTSNLTDDSNIALPVNTSILRTINNTVLENETISEITEDPDTSGSSAIYETLELQPFANNNLTGEDSNGTLFDPNSTTIQLPFASFSAHIALSKNIMRSVSSFSTRVSQLYYESAKECATGKASAWCFSGNAASKLQQYFYHPHAVKMNRNVTSSHFERYAGVALLSIGAIFALATFRSTRNRRNGYTGIPQTQ